MSEESTLVYIIRHGETLWNQIGLQQGHLNSPLTENGLAQAEAAALALNNKGISSLYSSDLGRAQETAEAIANKLKLNVIPVKGLRERNLGSMQGMTKDDFREQYPGEWESFSSGDPDYEFPGGESARQRSTRSLLALKEIALKHPGETILVVAHGGVLDGLFRHCLGIPLESPRRFSLFNGAINRFRYDGYRWFLEQWGELSHMKNIHSLDDN